jgi:inhibitor of cysteine peptidase
MARRRRRSALAVVVAAAALGAAQPRSEVRRVEVGEFFDGGTVRLGRGDVLVVRLPQPLPPATPWSFAFGDASILRPQGEPAVEDRTAVFRYVAAAPGGSSLGFAAVAPRDPAWTRLFRIAVDVTEAPPRSRTLVLSEADDGSRISVAKGDVLTVRLPSNVTTGYGWSVAQTAPGVLQNPEPPSYQPPAASQPGAGGTQTFTVQVIASGAGWLQLVYRRPFEKDTPPARTWGVFVAAADVAEPDPGR